MSQPLLFPVRIGSLSKSSKAQLKKAGVIVVEHANPEELRLLNPAAELNGSALLLAAGRALNASTLSQQTFAKEFLAALEDQHKKDNQ